MRAGGAFESVTATAAGGPTRRGAHTCILGICVAAASGSRAAKAAASPASLASRRLSLSPACRGGKHSLVGLWFAEQAYIYWGFLFGRTGGGHCSAWEAWRRARLRAWPAALHPRLTASTERWRFGLLSRFAAGCPTLPLCVAPLPCSSLGGTAVPASGSRGTPPACPSSPW
jgi:hypothetical protein